MSKSRFNQGEEIDSRVGETGQPKEKTEERKKNIKKAETSKS